MAEDLLSRADVARRMGVHPDSLSRAGLPAPDMVAGGRRYWRPDTIDRWQQGRPGAGARTDLHQVIALPGLHVGPGHGPQGHLAGLGLLRVLHEQRPEWRPTLSWQMPHVVDFGWRDAVDPIYRYGGTYPVLTLRASAATAAELARWLLEEWAPTPAISAWNGGSGLRLGYVADRQKTTAMKVPELASLARLGPRAVHWVDTLAIARDLVARARADHWDKPRLIQECRDRYPDPAVAWVDACWEWGWSGEGTMDPLLPRACRALGTGGNIGRADLGALVLRYFTAAASSEASQAWLDQALGGVGDPPLIEGTEGHLGMTGVVQPWRWLLAMEGMVGVNAVPRLLRTPTLRPSPCVLTAGYADDIGVVRDEVDHELWLPLWTEGLSWPQVMAALTGGQWLQWRGQGARDGSHAALALARATDNGGLDAYRYICAIRNGRSPVYLTQ